MFLSCINSPLVSIALIAYLEHSRPQLGCLMTRKFPILHAHLSSHYLEYPYNLKTHITPTILIPNKLPECKRNFPACALICLIIVMDSYLACNLEKQCQHSKDYLTDWLCHYSLSLVLSAYIIESQFLCHA